MASIPRCIKQIDVNTDPFAIVGERPIGCRTDPPPVVVDGKERPLEQKDFVTYANNLVWLRVDTELRPKRRAIGATAKERRDGHAPRVFSNWVDRAFPTTGKSIVRPLGLSVSGNMDGKATMDDPYMSGRFSTTPSGTGTCITDTRFFKNANRLDWVEALPIDSGARLTKDDVTYGLCILRPVNRDMIVAGSGRVVASGGGAGFSGHAGHGPETGMPMQTITTAYNLLRGAGDRTDDTLEKTYAALAPLAWHAKQWGLPVDVAPETDLFGGGSTLLTRWGAMGFTNSGGIERASIMFGIDGGDIAKTKVDAPFLISSSGGYRVNPLFRLPINTVNDAEVYDAIVCGSESAPPLAANVARILDTATKNWIIPESAPVYLRFVMTTSSKKAVAVGDGSATNVADRSVDQAMAAFGALVGEVPELGLAAGQLGATETIAVSGGDRGGMSTDIMEWRVSKSLSRDEYDALVAKIETVYNKDDIFRRFTLGASASSINKVFENYCAVCGGVGYNGSKRRDAPEVGQRIAESLFGKDTWDDLPEADRARIVETAIQKFNGFSPAIVMKAMHSSAGVKGHVFYADHPYTVSQVLSNSRADIGGAMMVNVDDAGKKFLQVPFESYFGVQLRRGNIAGSDAIDNSGGLWLPVSAHKPAAQTLRSSYPTSTLVQVDAPSADISAFVASTPTTVSMMPDFSTGADLRAGSSGKFHSVDNFQEVEDYIKNIPVNPSRIIGTLLNVDFERWETQIQLGPQLVETRRF